MAFEFRWVLFIGLLAASLVCIVLAVAIVSINSIAWFVALIFALIFDVLAMASRYYTYLFEPIRKMHKGKLVLDSNDPYIMAPSGNAIMKRDGELIYATVFVKIPIYRSGTEMQDPEKVEFAVMFGKMLSIIKEPFRISTQLYVLNKDEYLDKIRNKLNEAQDKYNQMVEKSGRVGGKETSPEIEHMRGEVTMWKNMFASVGRAKSHSMISYAVVSAAGGTEEEAVNLAIAKGDELAAGIGSTFGIVATIATGDEILQFIEPDHMIPVANLNEQISIRSGERQV